MLVSGVAVVLFLMSVLGILLFPKSRRSANGVKGIIIGTMAVLCYTALPAAVYNAVGITVNLKTTCISLAILDVLLWGGIIWKKRVQKMFWRVSDIVSVVLIAAFVIGIALHVFTPELKLQYWNIDAASHFGYANGIVHTGKWSSMVYFSAYIDAMFIELFSPFLAEVFYYKAFIIADIFMHVLEIGMFYCLVLTIRDSKVTRIMAPVLSIAYFFGYPAYSFTQGHFVYWSNGVVILMLIIYALLLIEKYEDVTKPTLLLLLLGAYANSCCNKLFVPTNTFALLVVLFLILLRRQKRAENKKKMLIGLFCIAVVALLAVVIYLVAWGDGLADAFAALQRPGGIYSSLYADLIFFLPPFFYVIYYVFVKKKEYQTVLVTSLCMLAITVGMYLLWYNHLIVNYYYYKIYYNLWLCGWLLVVSALSIMEERKKLAGFFSYFGMAAFVAWITLSGFDAKIAAVRKDYNSVYATSQLFPIYRYNMDSLETDYAQFEISGQILDIMNYAIEEMADENVRLVSEDVELRKWFSGIDRNHKKTSDFEKYNDITKLLTFLDKKDVDAIVVLKDEEKYQTFKAYFDCCMVVYENDKAAILKPVAEKWLEVE